MATKTYFLQPSAIRRDLAPGYGACYATDAITVEGKRVGFMYREAPDPTSGAPDSGWRFLAGTESQEYLDDPANNAIYDVNTIANYDPDIIPLLGEPEGSEFERGTDGRFYRVDLGSN